MQDEYLYGHMVQEYFVGRVRAVCARRARARAKIETPEQVMKLREQVRRKLLRSFGRMPERTPLNARITGTVERADYSIEKVIYESRPGLPVTANLYLPHKRRGKRPAVLGACGHSAAGKAEPLYQAFCQNLARQGYVVLIYDPISQGERLQYPVEEGVAQPKGCCQEHNMMGNQLALLGGFFGLWRAWDGIRGLDYLLTRPEVDPERVGVTGNSGGGTLTTYLTALDDRFTMAAPSCFITRYISNLENELPADSEQIPPGIVGAGLDMADFFVAHLPRPTLLLGQNDDFFDRRGLEQTFEELRRLYAIVGREDDVQLFIGPRGHGFSAENRQAMYRFFNRHASVWAQWEETLPEAAEDEEVLWACEEGQVHKTDARRVFDFISEEGGAAAKRRAKLAPEDIPRRLDKLLVLPKRTNPPHYRILRARGLKNRPELKQSTFALETEGGIQALMHIFADRTFQHFPTDESALLYIPHTSSQADAEAGLLPEAERVFALDVRGLGRARARTCEDEDLFSSYGSDYFYASQGHLLGEPYCGRRVHDVLSCLDLLASRDYKAVHLVGRGLGSVLATFAAVLHPLVQEVTLRNALLSFHELTQVPVQSWPLSIMVYGILRQFDLPDCFRLLQTRRLSLIDPWTSQMQPWEPEALSKHLEALGIEQSLRKPS